MEKVILKTKVQQDEITDRISSASDFAWTGENTFEVPQFEVPKDFGIGLIVGPSGSGKSSILKQLGREEDTFEWDNNKSVASHFENYEQASERFSAVALNSIPDQLKPFNSLSTGQKYRAQMARGLQSNMTLDEYTSVVDRPTALAISNSIRKYVDRKNLKNIILVGCHYDVIEFLNPDWVFDTKTGILTTERLARRRPPITLSVRKASKDAWPLFSQHHYLTSSIPNNTPMAFLYYWDKELVGFGALNTFPHPAFKSAWNISRVVVYPSFQGLGFGYQIIKNLAEIGTANFNHPVSNYGRVKIVTAIPALQGKLHSSEDWQFIKGSDVRKEHKDTGRKFGGYDAAYYEKHLNRTTQAFHYVGPKGFQDTTYLVIDDIQETEAWTDNKNRKQHKLTGKIIKDYLPKVLEETKYQKIVDPNYKVKEDIKCSEQLTFTY